MNKPRFGCIITKPKVFKKQKSFEEIANNFSENLRILYKALLNKGFSTDQSIQLLLEMIKK